MSDDQRKRRLLIAAASIAVAALALFAAWRYTPAKEWITPDNVIGFVEGFSGKWWAPVVLILAYTPASVVMFPRPLLTIAAVVAFGPWKGFAIAMAGPLVNALIGYAVGRQLDEKRLKRYAGKRLAPIQKMLKKEGFMAVAAVGLLPVAPFVVETVVFGALRVPLYHVLIGVSIAMAPGTIATTFLGGQVANALATDGEVNRWVFVGIVAFIAAMAWGTHRWWRHVQAQTA